MGLKKIILFISKLIMLSSRGHQTKTDRIRTLLNQTKTLKNKNLENLLKEEFIKKISLEVTGVECNEKQWKINQKVIAKTGGRVNWHHFNTAKKYLNPDNRRLLFNLSRSDRFSNWTEFTFGILFLAAGISVTFINYNVILLDKNISITLIYLLFYIITTSISMFFLVGTTPYFAMQRIKNEMKRCGRMK